MKRINILYDIIYYGQMIANLPTINKRVATAGEAISDGDTITGITAGLFSVRFCGIDTPEKGLSVKKNDAFTKDEELGYHYTEEFHEYLSNPFDKKYLNSEQFIHALGEEYVEKYLKPKLSTNTAKNHYNHAELAREGLIRLLENDIGRSIVSGDDFKFQINFPYDVLDRFDRFLGWIRRFDYKKSKDKSDSDRNKEKNYDETYNIRMLKLGLAIPYFIWPNLSTTSRSYNLDQLIPNKLNFKELIIDDKFISKARECTRIARQKHIGIFEKENPLSLLPFELRFLVERNYGNNNIISSPSTKLSIKDKRSTQKPLFRYVLNLEKLESSSELLLLKPNDYYKVENIEDRLFIPPEYVPLFKENGYTIL